MYKVDAYANRLGRVGQIGGADVELQTYTADKLIVKYLDDFKRIKELVSSNFSQISVSQALQEQQQEQQQEQEQQQQQQQQVSFLNTEIVSIEPAFTTSFPDVIHVKYSTGRLSSSLPQFQTVFRMAPKVNNDNCIYQELIYKDYTVKYTAITWAQFINIITLLRYNIPYGVDPEDLVEVNFYTRTNQLLHSIRLAVIKAPDDFNVRVFGLRYMLAMIFGVRFYGITELLHMAKYRFSDDMPFGGMSVLKFCYDRTKSPIYDSVPYTYFPCVDDFYKRNPTGNFVRYLCSALYVLNLLAGTKNIGVSISDKRLDNLAEYLKHVPKEKLDVLNRYCYDVCSKADDIKLVVSIYKCMVATSLKDVMENYPNIKVPARYNNLDRFPDLVQMFADSLIEDIKQYRKNLSLGGEQCDGL